MSAPPERQDILDMLASLGGRGTADAGETIDSMELAWLVQQVEQRHQVTLDLGDGEFARMSTVDGAVAVLRDVLEVAAPAAQPASQRSAEHNDAGGVTKRWGAHE